MKWSGDGPRNVAEAARYHEPQVRALAEAEADVLFAYTMTSVLESKAIALLAKQHGLPIVVPATIEVDGSLPNGESLEQWVEHVDEATDGHPSYYMVNCAHPEHLEPTLRKARSAQAHWLSRFKGLRANASRRSHAELDASPTLDAGVYARLARARDAGEHGSRAARVTSATSESRARGGVLPATMNGFTAASGASTKAKRTRSKVVASARPKARFAKLWRAAPSAGSRARARVTKPLGQVPATKSCRRWSARRRASFGWARVQATSSTAMRPASLTFVASSRLAMNTR